MLDIERVLWCVNYEEGKIYFQKNFSANLSYNFVVWFRDQLARDQGILRGAACDSEEL